MAITRKTARANDRPGAWDSETQSYHPIIIERREVVATINLDHSGSRHPLVAALDAVASYMSENLQDNASLALEFGLFGHDFVINANPVPTIIPDED